MYSRTCGLIRGGRRATESALAGTRKAKNAPRILEKGGGGGWQKGGGGPRRVSMMDDRTRGRSPWFVHALELSAASVRFCSVGLIAAGEARTSRSLSLFVHGACPHRLGAMRLGLIVRSACLMVLSPPRLFSFFFSLRCAGQLFRRVLFISF